MLGTRKKFFTMGEHDIMAEVAQRSCGWLISGSAPGQVGWDFK